jgi:hypothetical protein
MVGSEGLPYRSRARARPRARLVGAIPRIGPMGLIGLICRRGDESSACSQDEHEHDRRDSLENGLARSPVLSI